MTGGWADRRTAGRLAGLVPGAAVIVLLSACPPDRLSAQDSPAIRAAVQLAAEGRSDSARRLVAAQLTRSRAGDSSYVEALFWRARLAVSADSAERDLRRVAIEFSVSRWADDALVQLAQLALAAGNPASAVAYAQRLRTDYPGSDLRARAAFWGGRAAFDVGEPMTACALLDSARAEAAGDIEFGNQVAYYRARCTTIATAPRTAPAPAPAPRAPEPDSAAAARPDSTRTVTPRAPSTDPSPAPARPRGGYSVQVAATRAEADARVILDRFARAGHAARIDAGADGYFRVRLGPFPTLQAAQEQARAVRRLVSDTPFVVRP